VFEALEDSSKQLGLERKTGRDRILEDVALQRMPSATARAGLDTLAWADAALHHAWRLAESIRIASGN
jgi:phosphate:Na+ symporter